MPGVGFVGSLEELCLVALQLAAALQAHIGEVAPAWRWHQATGQGHVKREIDAYHLGVGSMDEHIPNVLHCRLASFPAAEMDVQAAVGLTAALTAIIISRQASGSCALPEFPCCAPATAAAG